MADIYAHPDWLGFLAAIRAEPDNDLPRLAAADWLDDRGQGTRAELIRVHCEFTRLDRQPLPPDDPCTCHRDRLPGRDGRYCGACERRRGPLDRLKRRVNALLARGAFGLLRGVPAPGGGFGWDRGFVASVASSAEWWVAHGDALLAREPVRTVQLTTVPDDVDRAAHGPLRLPAGVTVECEGFYRAGLLRGARRNWLVLATFLWPGVKFSFPDRPV